VKEKGCVGDSGGVHTVCVSEDAPERGKKRARTTVASSSHVNRRSLSENSKNNRQLSMSSGWEGAANNSSVSSGKRCSRGSSGEGEGVRGRQGGGHALTGGGGGMRGARGPASAASFRVGQRVWAWHVRGGWDWATIVKEPNERGQFTIKWADGCGSDTKKWPSNFKYTNLFTELYTN
jgi:hypothetical protein